MNEMVEPDRTIMIISIIGLVVIWGSFFYHRYLQDGDGAAPDQEPGASAEPAADETATAGSAPPADADTGAARGSRGTRKRTGKRRR